MSARHAGERARCSCGATLDVPTPRLPPPFPTPHVATPAIPIAHAVAVVAPSNGTWLILGGVGIGVLAMLTLAALLYATYAATTPAVVKGPRAPISPQQQNLALARPATPTAPRIVPTVAPPLPPAPVGPMFPEDGAWSSPAPGVRSMSVDLDNAVGLKTHVIVYLPEAAKTGSRLPCVFIAPAGSRLFHGMPLTKGDEAEHLPYVEAGFAVIGYSLGGPLDDDKAEDPDAMRAAFNDFNKSNGGAIDARATMDYATRKRPEIDAKRFYVAGHSSAANVALLVASGDPRVRGAAAYAPAADVFSHFRDSADEMERQLPGFRHFMLRTSPIHVAPPPVAKVMLFYAKDDRVINTDALLRYGDRVHARVIWTPKGGHFQPMLDIGIPAGIQFLQGIDATIPRVPDLKRQ